MSLFTPQLQPRAKVAGAGARLLQRSCDCRGKASGDCEGCRKKKLQRKASGGASVDAGASFDAAPQLTQGGLPLGPALASRLGPLFGSDFGDVRVHRDVTSAAAAREVGARAFTLGRHIHFGLGQWRPDDRDGLHLIAHELSHTLQHAGASGDGGGIEIDAPDSVLEREAERAADAAIAGRPARVRGGNSGSPLSRRLLQRAPDDSKGSGIGSAVGGSESATIDRSVDENTVVHIKRTVTEKPCSQQRETRRTPDDKIFYWDKDADAIGLRYSICNGKVQLSTKGEISYDKVVDSAKTLLTTLQSNPALGGDLGTLLQNRLDAATVSGSGDVTLTVDGILQASVQGSSSTGTGSQQYSVKGVLKITPRGMSFTVTGGADFSKTPLRQSTTYTLQGKFATDYFAISLKYEQIDTSQVGGGSSSKGQTTIGLDVPLPDVGPIKDVTLGPTVTIGPDGKPVFGGGIQGRFGGPDKTPEVRCYKCDCPPPLPEFSCNKVVRPHTKTVEDKPAEDRPVRLTYRYNSAVPAKEADYQAGLKTIAGLADTGFTVARIWGYASPEGSLDASAKGGSVFKGNQALSQARADDAHTRIGKQVPRASLPAAEGHAELLGSLDGSPDTPDKDLTENLVALLKDLTPDQRLDALGVSDAVRGDDKRKAKALQDIQDFIDGRARGVALAERPRWEKVFPFLRRVEVTMHHEPVTHPEPVKGGPQAGCQPEDLAYAKANLAPLPPQRRIPQERCGT